MMDEVVCQPCDDDGNRIPAYGFCIDCGEYLCLECYQSHCKPRQTRNHILLDKEEALKTKPTVARRDTFTKICPQHGGEYIKYFCSAHDVVGCSACITIDHRNCDDSVVFIPQIAENVVDCEELNELKKSIKTATRPLEDIITTSTANISLVEDNHAELVKAIDVFREEISASLRRLELSSREKADTWKDKGLETMNLTISKCKESLRRIQDMMKEIKSAEDTRSYCKLFIAVKTTTAAVRNIQEDMERLKMKNTINRLTFKPLEKLRACFNTFEELGVVSDTLNSPNHSLENLSTDADCDETVQPQIGASFIKDMYINSKRGTYDFCHVIGMAFVSKDRIVLIDNVNCTAKLFDIKRERISSELQFRRHEDLKQVVRVDDTHVVVLLSSGLILIHVDVDSSLNVDRYFLMSTDTRIISQSYPSDDGLYVFKGDGSITKVDMFGNETCLLSFKVAQNVDQYVSSAVFLNPSKSLDAPIYVTSANKIYKKCLACYSKDGDITDELMFKSHRQLEVIAMDETRSVLFVIADGIVHTVSVCSNDVNALWTSTTGLCRAISMAYCPFSKRLYVGIENSNYLKVYQLSGMPRQ